MSPDITICTSKTCSRRKRCWSHEVRPDEYRQSYTDFSEGKIDGWRICNSFTPVQDVKDWYMQGEKEER